MNIAYIQFGQWGGPYRTVMADGVEVQRETPRNPYSSGYGYKIPTRYKVLYLGKWRRVYAACYGNISSLWITVQGNETIVNLELD